MKYLFAIKIRWLNKENKWKQHTTKWHENLSKAWEEAYVYQNSVDYLEMSCCAMHKEKGKWN